MTSFNEQTHPHIPGSSDSKIFNETRFANENQATVNGVVTTSSTGKIS